MVISCPACGTRFGVRDDLIPPAGRKARCAACGELFRAMPTTTTGAGDEAHFQRIAMPGDGLASVSSFAAPEAPPEVMSAGHRPGSDTRRDRARVLVSPAAVTDEAAASSRPSVAGEPDPASPSKAAEETLASATSQTPQSRASGDAPGPGATVQITPEQLAALQRASAPAPASRPGFGKWRYKSTGGEEGGCSKKELVGLIRQGALSSQDLVLPEGSSDWVAAGSVRELEFYFQLQQAVPSWLARRISLPAELQRILKYPVQGWGGVMVAGYAAIGLFASLVPIFGLLFVLFLLTYNMLIVQESARGRETLPDWPEFDNWWEIVERGLKAVVVTVVSILPLFLFNWLVLGAATAGLVPGGDSFRLLASSGPAVGAGELALLAFFACYYPMAFGIASIFNTVAPVLNPAIVLKAIARIPREYVTVVGFFLAVSLAGACLDLGLRWAVPGLGRLLGALVWAYLNFAQMHLLGWTLHRAEHRLNWDIRI